MLRRLLKPGVRLLRVLRVRALSLPRGLPPLRRRLHLPANGTCDVLDAPERSRVRVLHLEAGTPFTRPLPDLPFDAAARPFFSARALDRDGPRFVAELLDATVWGYHGGAVFTADGRLVESLSRDPWGPGLHAAWTRGRLPRPRPLRGRTLNLVTPEATANYHHWLLDLLPRCGLVQRAGLDPAAFDHVLVNHARAPYQFDTLRRLGFAPEKIVAVHPGLSFHAECLVAPSLKVHNQAVAAEDLAFLRQQFLPAETARPPHRRLYLTRRDATARRLHDEPALEALLHAHGFESIAFSGLDVPAQAALMAEAACVVAPAGAALANLVFAPPHCHVVEISPPGWLTVYHWMISARLGLKHTILLGAGDLHLGTLDITRRADDIALDPARLAAVLPAALAPAPVPAPVSSA